MTDKKLNGKWQVIKSVSAGIEGATPAGTFLLIEDDLFERQTPEYVFKRIITTRQNTLPFQIDLLITNNPDEGKAFLGIYKVEAENLYIAHSLPGNPRPTDFNSTPENKQILSVSVKKL